MPHSRSTNPRLDHDQIVYELVEQDLLSHDTSSKNSSFTKLVRSIVNWIRESDVVTGKQFHCLIMKCGFSSNRYVGTSLIDMYSKHGLVAKARPLFDEISSKDMVVWNVMISCYSLNRLGEESFKMFDMMRVAGFVGDGFTFSSLLSSCTSLQSNSSLGKQTHGLVIRLAFDSDIVVGTALIDMYMKCGCIADARRAFNLMKHDTIVFWNAIIVGYGQNGDGKESMKLFRRMIQRGLKPDKITLASALSSCAESAMANEATQIHNCIVKNGFQRFLSIGNALIFAYAKTGCIYYAFRCFHSISNPDIISWTSMITSFAYHGLSNEALEMFEKMLLEGVKPDKITFLGVLSACSHAGLVQKGLDYFSSMRDVHQIEPSSEHYMCLVDLLGRFGHLDKAYNVIMNMPFEPDEDMLGAFIGACRVHGNKEFAKWAADRLFRIEPDEAVNYKLMSNIYGSLGLWDDVAKVRNIMRDKCNDIGPGCSWIETAGRVHTFVSHDELHHQATEIYCMLRILLRIM